MALSPARRLAFEILRRVEAEGAYAADLLHVKLTAEVKRVDAALATELTLGVLRWQRLLDLLIERQIGRPPASLDLEVLLALRLGFYQLRFLSRVPAAAAVNESVELAKWARKRSAAPLVNAVLRRAPRGPVEKLLPTDLPPADRLGILHSHPTWMVERWLVQFGEPRTIALLKTNNRAAHLTCAVHDAGRRDQVIAALKKAGLRVAPGFWLRSALVVRSGNPGRTQAFRRGWISMQDEASQMIPLLLDVRENQSVLDLCAAPGGKTAVLARAAGPKALVIAADRHAHRLRTMPAQLRRLGVNNIRAVALDATRPLPLGARFDRILVDAPCSGTGTLARNPEIRWRLRRDDLADFYQRQTALLAQALEHLAPGGRLVYATCSLELEENEQVAAEVLQRRSDLRSVAAAGALAPHLADDVSVERLFGANNFFRTFPPEHNTDGFFAAVLERQRRTGDS